MTNTPNPEWVYNHALYHLVYHWAAYVAFLVLLITIGVILSVAPVPPVRVSRLYDAFAIVVCGTASGFFLWRMDTFGKVVNQSLKGAAAATMWTSDPVNLWIGAAVTGCVVIADIVVLWKK